MVGGRSRGIERTTVAQGPSSPHGRLAPRSSSPAQKGYPPSERRQDHTGLSLPRKLGGDGSERPIHLFAEGHLTDGVLLARALGKPARRGSGLLSRGRLQTLCLGAVNKVVLSKWLVQPFSEETSPQGPQGHLLARILARRETYGLL